MFDPTRWLSQIKRPFKRPFVEDGQQVDHTGGAELLLYAALVAGETHLVKATFLRPAFGYRLSSNSQHALAEFSFLRATVYAVPDDEPPQLVPTCSFFKMFSAGYYGGEYVTGQLAKSPLFTLYFNALMAEELCRRESFKAHGTSVSKLIAHRANDQTIMLLRGLKGFCGIPPARMRVTSMKVRKAPQTTDFWDFGLDFGPFQGRLTVACLPQSRLREKVHERAQRI